MNDMTSVITPKSDQVSADDFIAGPRTFTIEGVAISPGTEQPVSIKLAGEQRVFRPCKSMSRVLVGAWGADASAYKGRSLTLYRDPKVKWGGLEVGGIRISHMSHIDRDMVMSLTATKGKRAPHQVKVLQGGAQDQQQSGPDKAADGATALIARIDGASDKAILDAITDHAVTVKQRDWLSENRPELAEKVDLAVSAAIERLAGASEQGRTDADHGDQFPGDEAQQEG